MLVPIFPASSLSYTSNYFKDRAMSPLLYHLLPLNVCNLKLFFWWCAMTCQFWIPVAIYHSYHWPFDIRYYWPQASIRNNKKKSLFFLVPWYTTLISILSFCSFSVFPFWYIVLLLSVIYGHSLKLRAPSAVCVFWYRVQQAFMPLTCVSSFPSPMLPLSLESLLFVPGLPPAS